MDSYSHLTKKQRETVWKGFSHAKRQGYAGTDPFLQESMNADKKACYFIDRYAFASVFCPTKGTAELTGFFLPHCINRYAYEDFLRTVIKRLRWNGRKQIYAVGNPFCSKETDILEGIFGKPEYAEYFLKKTGHFPVGRPLEERVYSLVCDGTEIGGCTLTYQTSGWYLHGLYIQQEYRNRGFGTKFLTRILSDLSESGNPSDRKAYADVFLQVSSQNVPAVKLYEKAGFFVSEQRDYYLCL